MRRIRSAPEYALAHHLGALGLQLSLDLPASLCESMWHWDVGNIDSNHRFA